MTVRLIGFMKRVPSISFEDFDRQWTDHGARVVTALPAVKSGLVKYKQFHTVPLMNTALESIGFPVAQYDGVGEWEAESLEDILGIFQSEEYKKNVHPHESNFCCRAELQVMAGRDQTDFGKGNACQIHVPV